MRKAIIYSCIFLLTLSAFKNKEDRIKITGNITGYPDSTMVVLMNFEINKSIDTTYIVDNKFHCSSINSKTVPGGIFIGEGQKSEYLFLFLEDVDIAIEGKKGEIKYAKVEGGELQKQNSDYLKSNLSLELQLDSIQKQLMGAMEARDMEKAKSISKQQSIIIKKRITSGAQYIEENPDKLYSAFMLKGFTGGLPKSEIRSLYENLSPKVKQSKYAKSTAKWLELNKQVKVGDMAENFELKDTKGNKVSLKDFEGKFVLLEFWKAGCPGCRTANKTLVIEYEKYRNKDFIILNISSDKNEDHWKRATKEDAISWPSLLDNGSKEGNVGARYNVSLIPTSILIDPSGRIIAKDLKGEKLGEALQRIFGM
ncbi:TlpA disulfide reductase family protein [Marinifilum sp. D714]|uniref:TlpA disulfide reductase family protein n=1 Tax=Marinifilum sp. D714 TaxID=2937523 RepID=UPI0027CFE66E|nr:TlpA disulfide reductase family protein [Marinifilum sp. D714]MDQ2177297.1 AhpC/TSA family protein [Marinifilum sp. D714]